MTILLTAFRFSYSASLTTPAGYFMMFTVIRDVDLTLLFT